MLGMHSDDYHHHDLFVMMTRLDMQGVQSDDYHHDCWRCRGCIVMITIITDVG